MKQLAILVLFVGAVLFGHAQVISPEQFLGYKIGTRYTPHHRIVEYFRTIAAASPSTVKLQQYGLTNEGRPLLLAYVSAPQNISNLETIRTNNLALTTAAGKSNASQPSIVWLSYNVHGNETSSSEAAMLTLHALTDPANAQTKSWLQNTVVIMDPCLNPDGRDRYVNWFNSVVGKTYNPLIESREHREPWPGGRSNHYNFDLNRDWAWQTQVETQQRLAVYNQWLPQIHVDFHEQGYNEPYYFAPAAEPFHEVITPWQRDFQNTIGRNHARYFDAAGWLYFTKERFDLLYPSYGDTYPIYNGSIGMTYEQGGGGAGGLGVITENGDTLTLADRALHHHTTGLSTVEVASKNADRLITEFEKFYRDANKGIGEYSAYVVKMRPDDTTRVYSLIELLNKNGIRYFSGRGTNLRGFNYNTLKDEGFSLGSADLVIPAGQPKGALVKVLFEQNTKLSDSATYDITAWSLPYAYGLQAYATKTPVTGLETYPARKVLNPELAEAPYAYVIPWDGLGAAKLTGQLLQKGVKLRFITQPFSSGGQNFGRGSVLIIRAGNQQKDLWSMVRNLANQASVRVVPVSTGFVEKGADFGSSSVMPMKARKVALFTGEGVSSLGAGEVWHYFEQVLNYPITLINANDAGRFNWSNYDVVIMPDGGYRFLTEKASAEALRNWVNSGGQLIAMEGAVSALSRLDWAIKTKKEDSNSREKDPYENLRRYDDREREALKDYTPGSIYKVELDNSHPLAFGYPTYYHTLKQDASQYEFFKAGGWNVGVVKKEGPVSGFVGTALTKRLQNRLVFGVQEVGRGTVTYLTDDVLFRSFWENGKLLFANAVFLVGQ